MLKSIKVFILIITIFFYLFFFNNNSFSNFREINFDKKVQINDIIFNTYFADTEEKRILGLSNVKSMNDNEAMLFIFNSPQVETFWMKDMNFNLDIIWIDENKKIIKIDKNVTKESYNKANPYLSEKFSSGIPVKYVLEINAGLSDRKKINTGDYLK